MQTMITVFHLACGRAPGEADGAPARRAQLALAALFASLVMSALWGAAAGSAVPSLALMNLYKLPLIVVLAGVGAVPAGLLAWKLSGAEARARELLHGYALAMFLGTMVMLVLSPLVALYYHSSASVGPVVAVGSVLLAIVAGTITFVRNVRRTMTAERQAGPIIASVVLVGAFAATLWQLVAVLAPILPEHTLFSGGIDAL
jgi:hypothetical protein